MLAFSYFFFAAISQFIVSSGPVLPGKKEARSKKSFLFPEYGAVLVPKAAPLRSYGAEKWLFAHNLTTTALKTVN